MVISIANSTDESYLLEFVGNITKYHTLLIEKNVSLFQNELIKDIPLQELVNYDLTTKNLNVIWKYLNIMYVYGFNYTKDKNLAEILESLKKPDVVIDEASQTFLNIIEMMKNTEADVSNVDENTNIDEQLSENIFGGSIGKLAFDIAKDINIADFENEDPTQMLTSLMSGKIDPDSKLMKLFENVTNKINEKITSGNIDSSLLEKEAGDILSQNAGGLDLSSLSAMMQGGGGAGGGLDLSVIASMMGGGEGAGGLDIASLASMMGGALGSGGGGGLDIASLASMVGGAGGDGGADLSSISSIMQKNLTSLNNSNIDSSSRKEKKRALLRKKLKERRMNRNKK